MRDLLKAFALGFVALAALLFGGGLTLGIVAEEGGWESFRLAAGPLELFVFEQAGPGTATTFGAGLAVLALAGGLLNAAAGWWLRRAQGTSRTP